MKLEQRETQLMTLLSFVLITLMLVIVSPTYVQADTKYMSGTEAMNWLKGKGYIKRDGTDMPTEHFRSWKERSWTAPPSPDGLGYVSHYSQDPWNYMNYPIENPMIIINLTPTPPIGLFGLPVPPGSTHCKATGPNGRGFMVGNKQSGSHCMYHNSNGRLSQVIPYANGLRHGLGINYYDNGYKSSETPYRNGKKHGQQLSWYRNGNLKSKLSWENGKQRGEYRTWYKNGRPSACWTYYYDGSRNKCPL